MSSEYLTGLVLGLDFQRTGHLNLVLCALSPTSIPSYFCPQDRTRKPSIASAQDV